MHDGSSGEGRDDLREAQWMEQRPSNIKAARSGRPAARRLVEIAGPRGYQTPCRSCDSSGSLLGVSPGPAAPARRSGTSRAPDMPTPTVLLVEDNEDNLHIYSTILRHAGYGVIEVGCDGYIAKPAEPMRVLAEVRRIVGEAGPA